MDSAESGKIFYAAKIDEKFVAIGGSFRDENGEWKVIAVYTKPANRGVGIGSKILLAILGELKLKKIAKAFLMVNVNQSSAVSLYQGVGFFILNTHKNQLLGDGKYYDEYEMVYNF